MWALHEAACCWRWSPVWARLRTGVGGAGHPGLGLLRQSIPPGPRTCRWYDRLAAGTDLVIAAVAAVCLPQPGAAMGSPAAGDGLALASKHSALAGLGGSPRLLLAAQPAGARARARGCAATPCWRPPRCSRSRCCGRCMACASMRSRWQRCLQPPDADKIADSSCPHARGHRLCRPPPLTAALHLGGAGHLRTGVEGRGHRPALRVGQGAL